jgi:hypothetical protein
MTTPIFIALFGLLFQRGAPQRIPGVSSEAAANPIAVVCQPELRWINSDLKVYSLGATFQVNLFSSVGSGCTPAELRVTAVYLDTDENVVCTGVVDNVAQLDQNTQATILEFKPLTTLEFVRWRNGLRPPQPIAKRLTCIAPDQLTDVTRTETDRASSLRLFITVLPRNGGVSSVEIKVDPNH